MRNIFAGVFCLVYLLLQKLEKLFLTKMNTKVCALPPFFLAFFQLSVFYYSNDFLGLFHSLRLLLQLLFILFSQQFRAFHLNCFQIVGQCSKNISRNCSRCKTLIRQQQEWHWFMHTIFTLLLRLLLMLNLQFSNDVNIQDRNRWKQHSLFDFLIYSILITLVIFHFHCC